MDLELFDETCLWDSEFERHLRLSLSKSGEASDFQALEEVVIQAVAIGCRKLNRLGIVAQIYPHAVVSLPLKHLEAQLL